MLTSQQVLYTGFLSCIAAMCFLTQAMQPAAIFEISNYFHCSLDKSNLLFSYYLLSLNMLLLFCGKLINQIGSKSACLIGLAIFGLSSVFTAFIDNINMLIMVRFVQGIGVAFLLPSSNILLNQLLSNKKQRYIANSLYVGAQNAIISIGLIMGGVLVDYCGWRSIFMINIPLSIILFLICLFVPIEKKTQSIRLDLFGLLLFSLCIFRWISFINHIDVNHLDYPDIALELFANSVLSLAFAAWEKNIETPMLDFSIFKEKLFVNVLMICFCIQIFIILILPILVTFFVKTMHWTTALSNIRFAAPITLFSLIMPKFCGSMRDKYGFCTPNLIGNIMIFLSLLWITALIPQCNYWFIFPAILCYSLALPFLTGGFSPIVVALFQDYASPIAILSLTRQMGNLIGLSIFNAIVISFKDDQYHITIYALLFMLLMSSISIYFSFLIKRLNINQL